MEENLNKPKATESMAESESQMPILLSFLVDRANIVILLRLGSGILAIYFSLTQNFPAAIIAMLWAVLLGRQDGLVARATPGRSEFQKMMRVSMASPVDLISFAVVPAILLLSVGEFSGWFYPGALVIVMAGVLCLAYFNVYGVDENGTYAGLPLDFTPFV